MTDRPSPVRHWPLPVLGLALTAVALGWMLVAGYLVRLASPLEVTDFQVYREAVGFWLGGGDLYQYLMVLPDGRQMPFTYPPFAAILMLPTSWLPLPVGWLLSVAAQLALLLIATILLARRTGVLAGLGRPEATAIIGAGWLALTVSEPSLHGIALGQVSLMLIVVVLLDAVVVPPRWRGLLTGLAAAIKLTPGIFLVYFLLTRQWRAAVNAAVGGLVATAIGFAVLPGPSWRYWTSLLFDTSRVGEPDVTRNKSLLGLLSHLGMTGPARTAVWIGLAVIVVAIGLWQARRSYGRGTPLAAVLTVGLLSTVISPVSWPHHLVWLPLAGLYLAFCPGWRRRLGMVLVLGFLAGTPLLSYDSGLPIGWAVAGDVVTVVLLIGALVGVPGRPAGEVGS
ncbi:alpha-1,2-mannosyltransferase [Propionicimonas paludicola]|uniref:Alpha-1,2-mannosyltransferase n=1 Tax=Propionicimonas paludicola TaxID=185243 RepID=A0A2A9CPV0_9ACTN|nr:glycosyltransferase 87 family protein [Propionicimonas paludicola]PFG15690.1 alpha-1,2-mannosyltransferase [Propionicimonas paludicola]